MSSRSKLDTDIETTRRMKNVRTKDTLIERKVRDCIDNLGVYYTTENSNIPGRPDMVLPHSKTAIFTHGCFWHGHTECKKGTVRPRRNADFWETKIEYNAAKDVKIRKKLEDDGWNVAVIWECEILKEPDLTNLIKKRIGRALCNK